MKLLTIRTTVSRLLILIILSVFTASDSFAADAHEGVWKGRVTDNQGWVHNTMLEVMYRNGKFIVNFDCECTIFDPPVFVHYWANDSPLKAGGKFGSFTFPSLCAGSTFQGPVNWTNSIRFHGDGTVEIVGFNGSLNPD